MIVRWTRRTLLTIDLDSFTLSSTDIPAILFFSSRRSTFLASWIATWAIFTTEGKELAFAKYDFHQAFLAAVTVLWDPIPPRSTRVQEEHGKEKDAVVFAVVTDDLGNFFDEG